MLSRVARSEVWSALLVLLLAVSVRVAHHYLAAADPRIGSAPSGSLGEAAASYQGPLFAWMQSSLDSGGSESIQWVNLVLGVGCCLLVLGTARRQHSPGVGLLAGCGAVFLGPMIYFGTEPTPAVWSAFLLALLAYLIARPPPGRLSRTLAVGGLALLAAAEFAGLPARIPDSIAEIPGNLYYMVQGREWLPDMDPYRSRSAILLPLLWDWGLAFPAGLLIPLAAIGLAVHLRRGGHAGTATAVLIGTVLLAGAATGADGRHRLPLLVLLLPFAAGALLPQRLTGRSRAGAFLLLLLAANAATQPPSHLAGQTEHDYWTGRSLEQRGLQAYALEAYDRALAADPDHRPALVARARLAMRDGDPARALRLYQSYMEDNERTSELLYLAGRAYVAMDRNEAAAAVFERAVALGDSSAELLGWLGHARSGSGQTEAAARAYTAAVQLRPDSLELHYQLARTHELVGRGEAALERYRRILTMAADDADIHARIGHLLIATSGPEGESIYLARDESTKEAEHHLRRAIELEQDHLSANLHLAILLARQRRYKEAIAQFDRTRELAPEEHELHLYLGNLYERAGDSETAQHHFAVYRGLARGVEVQGMVSDYVKNMLGDGELNRFKQ